MTVSEESQWCPSGRRLSVLQAVSDGNQHTPELRSVGAALVHTIGLLGSGVVGLWIFSRW